MNEIENDLKSKLKILLSDKFWTVKQFHPTQESDRIDIKVLFEDIPGILTWDFQHTWNFNILGKGFDFCTCGIRFFL